MFTRRIITLACAAMLIATAAATAAPVVDYDRERARTRQHSEAFDQLRQGLGAAGQQERRAAAEQARRVDTIQPHFAATHPWAQEPVAEVGRYVPLVNRFFLRRPIIINRHHHFILPLRRHHHRWLPRTPRPHNWWWWTEWCGVPRR